MTDVTAVEAGLSPGFGARLRVARQRAHLTTRELAELADVSAGFVSQLENDRRGVSIGVLKRIAQSVGLTAAELLADTPPHTRDVLRAADRPVFDTETGVRKLLMSRAPLRQLEVYEGLFPVGSSTGDELYSHDDAQEMFHVLEGEIELTVSTSRYLLGPGDTLEYLSSVPHRAANIGSVPARIMWITSHISPPTDRDPANSDNQKGQH